MWNWEKNRFFQMMAKLNHLLSMAGRTEPSSSTGKCQNHLMVAVRTFDSGEALVKISTLKILIHYMRYYLTVKPVLLLKKLVIALLELEKVAIQELPQRSLLRLSPFVNTSNTAAFHVVPSCGEKNDCSSEISHFSYIGKEIEGILSPGILLLKFADDRFCHFCQDLIWSLIRDKQQIKTAMFVN